VKIFNFNPMWFGTTRSGAAVPVIGDSLLKYSSVSSKEASSP